MITYDRSERCYKVPYLDTVAVFQSGKDGKKEAFQFMLMVYHEALYKELVCLVSEYWELESRLWSAAKVIINNQVVLLNDGSTIGMAASSKGDLAYTIMKNNELICTCDDYQSVYAPFTETGQRWCKHILACDLKLKLTEKGN